MKKLRRYEVRAKAIVLEACKLGPLLGEMTRRIRVHAKDVPKLRRHGRNDRLALENLLASPWNRSWGFHTVSADLDPVHGVQL